MTGLEGVFGNAVRKRTFLVALVAMVAIGATACLPPSSQSPPDAVTSGVLTAMNNDRAANGLPALGWNGQLAGLASGWATHLATADGGLVHQDLSSVMDSPGYSAYMTLGENLLVGPDSMSTGDMETAWMNSPGHRANILRGSFTSAGVGYVSSGGRVWVVVEFGG